MAIYPARIKSLHRHVFRWYARHRRRLQWRFTDNAYEILVSEIMLQQTQVERVKIKYPLFLKKYPTVESLATARVSDVLHAWQGMGYNNRAVRLKQLAMTIVSD